MIGNFNETVQFPIISLGFGYENTISTADKSTKFN